MQRNSTSWVKLSVSVAGFHEPDTPLSKKTGSSAFTLLSPKYMGLHIKDFSIAFPLLKFTEMPLSVQVVLGSLVVLSKPH